MSQGLVNGNQQARANIVDEEEKEAEYGNERGEPVEGRANRNSKYRPDCWGQDEEESVLRRRRGVYERSRGRGGRGGAGAPCLWETEYYMGDNINT